MLTDILQCQGEVVERNRISRVSLFPLLEGFDVLVFLSLQRAIVVRRDVKLFPLARPVFRVKSLLQVLRTVLSISRVAVRHAESGERHGEIWVELDGAFQM